MECAAGAHPVVEDVAVDVTEPVSTSDGEQSGDFAGSSEGSGVLPSTEVLTSTGPGILDVAEVMPEYEGGLDEMMRFIQRKMRYPRVPRQQGIEGMVFVRFIVNGDGSVSDVEVIRGIHPDCDAEAARVIKMLPSWKGGSHNGRPVSVRMVLPIKFRLQ